MIDFKDEVLQLSLSRNHSQKKKKKSLSRNDGMSRILRLHVSVISFIMDLEVA